MKMKSATIVYSIAGLLLLWEMDKKVLNPEDLVIILQSIQVPKKRELWCLLNMWKKQELVTMISWFT